MKTVIVCHDAQQAHKALTAVLWPKVKAHLICGGGKLVVTVKPETRSLEQNARLWAMLADISSQVVWHGRKLDSESWKTVFTASLRTLDVVPNIAGTGFVALGMSTSKMTRAEMAELQTLIEAFGSEHNVKFSEPEQ